MCKSGENEEESEKTEDDLESVGSFDQYVDPDEESCPRLDFARHHYEIQLHGAIAVEKAVVFGGAQSSDEVNDWVAGQIEQLIHFVTGAAGGHAPGQSVQPIGEAYKVLGVPQSASDAEVKKAYRRLTNQHHPDKLVAKGMPEEMVKLANEKTQEIRRAWERIRDHRKAQA